MFTIKGGNYNKTDYSCMFDTAEKYDYMTSNEKYYGQLGKNDETKADAMLVFDSETDKLVYAWEFPQVCQYSKGDLYIHQFSKDRMAELEKQQTWLAA